MIKKLIDLNIRVNSVFEKIFCRFLDNSWSGVRTCYPNIDVYELFIISVLLIDRQRGQDWRKAQHACLVDSPILVN